MNPQSHRAPASLPGVTRQGYTAPHWSMGRKAASVIFMTVVLCLILCGCANQTANGNQLAKNHPGATAGGAGPSQPAPAKRDKKEPVVWNLSPEAQHMYYYLLLNEALLNDDQEMLYTALKGLLEFEPSLPMYQDGISALLSKGKNAEARDLALQGLKSFPDEQSLTLLLSVAYSEGGETPKAIELLQEARKKDLLAKEYTQELMRLYMREGRTDEAEALFMEMPSKGFDPKLLFLRAHILAGTGKTAEAKAELRKILQQKPDFLEAWLELGLIAEREGDLKTAAETYRKAAELAPDNLDIWFRLVVMLVDAKKPAEAMQAISSAPTNGDFLLQASYFFIEAGYLDEADTLLKDAESQGAHPDEVLLYRSVLTYRRTDDTKAALAQLEEIPPHSPFYQKGLLRRVQLLLDAKMFEDALTATQFARGSYPDNAEFWTLESYCLMRLAKPQEAEATLREGLTALPGNEDILYALGGLLEETGRRKDAFAVMEDLLKANPENAKAMNYVGYTLADENRDLERAYDLITGALRHHPNADYIVDSLAWVQYRMGRLDEAWESINRCLDMGGDDPAIWEHYGDIASAMGKKVEARKGYDEALKRNAPNAEQIKKKLEGL